MKYYQQRTIQIIRAALGKDVGALVSKYRSALNHGTVDAATLDFVSAIAGAAKVWRDEGNRSMPAAKIATMIKYELVETETILGILEDHETVRLGDGLPWVTCPGCGAPAIDLCVCLRTV